jgi:hypothetical protein
MNAPVREARTSVDLTAADLARTLEAMQQTMTLPLLLSDALDLKRARGDGDCFTFAHIAKREFGSGLNATVPGALEALKQWTRKGAIQRTPAVEAFMADLAAIEAGTFGKPVREEA